MTASTRSLPNVEPILDHRQRRWPNIDLRSRICCATWSVSAGLDGSFVSTGACNMEVPGSNLARAGYLSSWLCIYSILQTVQRNWMYSAAYGTEHLKSFEIRMGHSPGFGLPFVAILPLLCRKRRKAIFTHLHTHMIRVSGDGVLATAHRDSVPQDDRMETMTWGSRTLRRDSHGGGNLDDKVTTRKHSPLTRCRINVGPTSATLAQH